MKLFVSEIYDFIGLPAFSLCTVSKLGILSNIGLVECSVHHCILISFLIVSIETVHSAIHSINCLSHFLDIASTMLHLAQAHLKSPIQETHSLSHSFLN
jgi:hypothetical protein